MLVIQIVDHLNQLLHFVLDHSIVEASFLIKHRDQHCCFKVPKHVLVFLKNGKESSIKVKYTHCKLSIFAIS